MPTSWSLVFVGWTGAGLVVGHRPRLVMEVFVEAVLQGDRRRAVPGGAEPIEDFPRFFPTPDRPETDRHAKRVEAGQLTQGSVSLEDWP